MHQHVVFLPTPIRDVAIGATRDTIASKGPIEKQSEDVDINSLAVERLQQSVIEFGHTLHVQRAKAATELAQTSVELAIQIAERLIGGEIAADRQRLDQIVLASLERIQVTRSIAIKANPLDLQLLQKQLSQENVPDRYAELLNFQVDDGCPRGRLKLETDELFIEWDTQRSLVEIRNALVEEIYSEAAIP